MRIIYRILMSVFVRAAILLVLLVIMVWCVQFLWRCLAYE